MHQLVYFHFHISREKRLITKEHIVTHTCLNFAFKWALDFSTLSIKLFNSGAKLFQAMIINTAL